jgi:hypothetical protein
MDKSKPGGLEQTQVHKCSEQHNSPLTERKKQTIQLW